MQLEQPAIATQITLSVSFDEKNGVIAVGTAHAPPLNLRSVLAYKLTADQARQLASALTKWADSQP